MQLVKIAPNQGLYALGSIHRSGEVSELGGPCRDRTDDPRIKSPLLYRLS